MSFSFHPSAVNLQKWIGTLGLLVAIMLTGCNSPQPIDTSNPISFKHRSGVFEMQVPKSWKQAQDQVETESLAAFSDQSGRSEIIGYAGLLDHTLGDDEGLTVVQGLVKNLLNAPQDLTITDKQRRGDGAFALTLSFTRNNEKRLGQAIFRQGDLALAGVVVSGPESEWKTLQSALQPYVDSFKLKPDFVQGTYFTPMEDTHFALVVPANAALQNQNAEQQARSPSGNLIITGAQQALPAAFDVSHLADAVVQRTRQVLGTANLVSTESLPDGRLKAILNLGEKRVVAYAEPKDGMLITVFFTVPAAQADAYQPIIDFMYSTLVTGKS